MIKSIPYLFVCFCDFQLLSPGFKSKTKYKLCALRIHQCKYGQENFTRMNPMKASFEQIKGTFSN